MKCLDGQWRARLIRPQAQPKRYNVEKAEDERYQQKLLLRCEVIVEAASRLWCKHRPLRIDRFEQLICNQRKSNGWTLKAICEAKGHHDRIEMDPQAVGPHLRIYCHGSSKRKHVGGGRWVQGGQLHPGSRRPWLDPCPPCSSITPGVLFPMIDEAW